MEKKEKKISETLIKLMEKRGKYQVILEEENRAVRLIKPIVLKINPTTIFRMLPLKKFLSVVDVKTEEVVRTMGREQVEKLAEHIEKPSYLRVELFKKAIRQ